MSLVHELPKQRLCAGVIFGYRSDGRSLEVYRYVSTQPQQNGEVEEPVRNESSTAVNNSQPTRSMNIRANGSCRSRGLFHVWLASRCMGIPFPREPSAEIFSSTSISSEAMTSMLAFDGLQDS